ncbi:MAG TPA: DUF3445 domain-containing protein [Steroidobacteraceae bacterium]
MHTPFDGSSPPFHIGVSRVALDAWIEVDHELPRYLGEKRRLGQVAPFETFVEEPGTREAQAELLELLCAHLLAHFPAVYRKDGSSLSVIPTGESVALDVSGEAPLRIAAALVQEDLILMRRAENGWRLAAGSLSFPSSWHLREKFGRPMPQIHGAVPGFGVGSKNIGIIERMFDNLETDAVFVRWNWGFYDDGALYHPAPGNGIHHFAGGGDAKHIFLRVERQTLRKLPRSRDVVFTIRTHLNPLSTLEHHPERKRLAAAMMGQIDALSPQQLAYKGLADEHERLLSRLRELTV